MIKISICIPIYKVEHTIERCLLSVLQQDYENIEIILVDDCSPDNSIDIAKRTIDNFDKRHRSVIFITHDSNKGLSTARNTAVSNSTGDYIIPLDSDDALGSDSVISRIVREIENTKADVVLYDYIHIFPNGVKQVEPQIAGDKDYIVHNVLRRECPVCLCGGAYKKTLFSDNDIWSIDGVGMGEDYAVKPRLIKVANRVSTIHDAYYLYYHNGNTFTSSISEKHISDIELVLSVLESFFNSSTYLDDLIIARAKLNVELAISYSLHSNNVSLYRKILDFGGEKIYSAPHIIKSKKDRIIIWAMQNLPHGIVRMICKCGFSLKQIIKIIKL